MPDTTTRYTTLRGLADTSNITAKVLHGTTFTVIPVIGLKEKVVTAIGSPGPEYVPADVLATGAFTFANKPAVLGHPMEDGVPVSANTPSVLESYQFGDVFFPSTDNDNGDLTFEVWLDPELAANVEGASEVLERAASGEIVEVSIGAQVESIKQSGTFNGENYEYVWLRMIGDHLALLPPGQIGACSVEDGCGTRVAISREDPYLMRAAAQAPDDTTRATILGLRHTARQLLLNGEPSDMELRQELRDALQSVVPGYDWLGAVHPNQGICDYETYIVGRVKVWRANYTLADDNSVTIAPLPHTELEYGLIPKQLEGGTMTIEQLVDKVIGCGCNPFTEASRDALLQMPEDELSSILEQAAPATDPPDEPAAAAEDDPAMVSIPEAKLAEYEEVLAKYKADKAAARAATIATLRKVNEDFTEGFLETMTDEQLETLSSTIKAPVLDPPVPFRRDVDPPTQTPRFNSIDEYNKRRQAAN